MALQMTTRQCSHTPLLWPSQQQHLRHHLLHTHSQLNAWHSRRARGTGSAGLHSRGTAPPPLTASEISRGLVSNTDLHLRQHYDEHINWDADKEESRVWRRTVRLTAVTPQHDTERGTFCLQQPVIKAPW